MIQLRLDKLQPLGRALMLPIAVLPIAGLLLRLGQPDLLDVAFVAAAGDAIFSHLGLLFGIGVAVGLARENHGAAGLAGAVCFFVLTEGAKALLVVTPDAAGTFTDPAARDLAIAAWKTKQLAKLSVPAGILSGVAAGMLYNRFSDIKLPDYLAFFGGRRFVPIVAGGVGLVLAVVFGLGFPWLEAGIDQLSRWVVESGNFGLFAYGFLNRILIVTGLHHIINNIAWFIIGDFHGTTGDLKRFFAGDPSAGAFMAGFFPVMMFGLPAACLAMYHTALPDRRKAVAGMLLSLALTSFLTGVTEPIEFSFMFLAPALYALHAVLTGLSMVVMNLLGVKLGFGFSAGLFDYLLDYGISTRPLLLIPVGLAYFGVYYFSFRWCIRYFDLKTPGRDAGEVIAPRSTTAGTRGGDFVLALGGPSNLATVDACMTRLRLTVNDLAAIDETQLRALGAKGIVRPGGNAVQVVLGPIADQVAGEIRASLHGKPKVAGDVWFNALGGADNVEDLRRRSTRLIVRLADAAKLDEAALKRLGVRAITRSGGGRVHLLFDETTAENAAAAIQPA
ncbi:N-acetylglucosamine-specific PTS transporter subunit IIBC [Sphingomonas segetis]|jgi:PTS system N-acetylglucosamine-specific IIC component|uniref:N-acetylglucosamine-specific PTS transporter subunit IIBC n=1 Tax=Sphingomonas segetis TaxID=1104779 RepID=UPI0012D2EE5B|nr:N-acetylglucosamine-specific PTS transporter subunit IIBC [Sphingomonas segetis]